MRTKIVPKYFIIVSLVCLCVVFLSCKKKERADKIKPFFENSFIESIIPLSDGGAYAIGLHGVYFLSQNKAFLVVEDTFSIEHTKKQIRRNDSIMKNNEIFFQTRSRNKVMGLPLDSIHTLEDLGLSPEEIQNLKKMK
jgi:hypothetical protein